MKNCRHAKGKDTRFKIFPVQDEEGVSRMAMPVTLPFAELLSKGGAAVPKGLWELLATDEVVYCSQCHNSHP